MGISNKYHFDWINEASKSEYSRIRKFLSNRSVVIGIGENAPPPSLLNLLGNIKANYQACDLYPVNEATLKLDINDLSPLVGKYRSYIIECLRTSFFLSNKKKFLKDIAQILVPGGYLIIDFLIGNSSFPSIEWNNIAEYNSVSCHFKTTFYDERLIEEFPEEVKNFCAHAKRCPIKKRIRHFIHSPKEHKESMKRLKELKNLNINNFRTRLINIISP